MFIAYSFSEPSESKGKVKFICIKKTLQLNENIVKGGHFFFNFLIQNFIYE